MTPRHPVRAAIAAAFVVLVVIAIFGNQYFTEHVVLDANGDLARVILRIPNTFAWRWTRLGNGTTFWVAQLAGVVLVIAGVFLLVWFIAQRATGLALFIGAWGATILAAMFAGWVEVLITYGELFRDIGDPQHFGRFWYAVFFGAEPAALFGAGVGLFGGLGAMLLAGSASRPVAPVMWQPSPAGGGYGGVSLTPIPEPLYGTDPTTAYPTVSPVPADRAGEYPYTSEPATAPPPPPPPGAAPSDPTTVMPATDEWNPTPNPTPPTPPPTPPPRSPWGQPEDPTDRG